MKRGFKFQPCPRCSKRGVMFGVSRTKSGIVAHRICKYCGWFEVSKGVSNGSK